MFGWRKKNEGFEWREYVRTTILVRRKERRQRVEDAKAAAVFGVKQAGRGGAEAALGAIQSAGSGLGIGVAKSASGLRRLFAWLGSALAAAGRAIASALSSAWTGVRAVAAPALRRFGGHLARWLEPAAHALRQPGLSLPLTLVAWVCGATALYRLATKGIDSQTLITGGLGLAGAILTLAPRLVAGERPRLIEILSNLADRAGEKLVLLPGFDRLRPASALSIVLLSLAALGGTGTWLAAKSKPLLPSLPNLSNLASLPLLSSPKLEGRALAVSGDSLKISGTIVTLAGVEAPLRQQTCAKPGLRRWSCGEAAKDALAHSLRGRHIICEITGTNGDAGKSGRCSSADGDIAAGLVKKGHVFAVHGLFSNYASLEAEAQGAKSGLWAGDALRPEDWRAKKWDEAKSAAPGGCPIKGHVSSSGRVYVLPWSSEYEQTKVRETKGERWFCSEAEAMAAGWRPVTRS